jgi:serine/threonine-protein kinase RsbW
MKKKRTFPGRFTSLEKISEFVTQAAQACGLNDADIYAVELAVDEAATNIIEHAYGGEGQGTIECGCEILKDGLCVVLRDQGRPFNPNGVPTPKLSASLEDIKPRGLGIFFMRKMMDEVRYDFIPGSGNVLTMIKRKKSR